MKTHVVIFCVLATIVMLGISTSAGMPNSESTLPQTSRFTVTSTSGDIQQSAADPTGFDSGLWRAEYLTQHKDEEDTQENLSGTAFGEAMSSGTLFTPEQRGKDNTLSSLLYSDKLAMMPIDIPIVMGNMELQPVRDSEFHAATPTMSDWEHAAVTATKSRTIGFTTSGPSATSAIVGFVGIMIVIGAYVSSSERKQ